MLFISRPTQRVTGLYIVNLALPIPAAFLGSATTANLHLESQRDYVDATVRVLAAPEPINRGASTRLVFRPAGLITVRLHELGNVPCAIEAVSSNRDVNVSLPRDFVGLIQTTSAHVPTLPSWRCRTLSKAEGTGRYFIGDWEPGAGSWDGHTVKITAVRGYITVKSVYPAPWYKPLLSPRFLFLMAVGSTMWYRLDGVRWASDRSWVANGTALLRRMLHFLSSYRFMAFSALSLFVMGV
ncbi:hypothetical protein AURDEDRAFT_171261 [Auricularia subglabra TFB-10046 SS5]|nr:hypothetical protein AURDEDRAFT_171261 [Auricularia subglabra TFB-10046 SS5]